MPACYFHKMWKPFLSVCAIVWLLCWTSPAAFAQARSPLVLDPTQGSLSLAGHIDWLEDRMGRQALEGVRQSPDWQRLPGKLQAGFTSSAIWVRLTVQQPQPAAAEWILVIHGTQIDEAVLYAPTDMRVKQAQRAGRMVAHTQWPIDSRTPAFRIALPPGEHHLYLRLKSEHTLSNDMSLQTPDAFRLAERRESLFMGAFFGVYMLALTLQMLFGGALIQSGRGWYLAYTFTLGLVALISSGYIQTFVFSHWRLPASMVPTTLALALVALVRMTIEWLKLDLVMPRFSRWYRLSVLALALGASGWALLIESYRPVLVIQLALLLHILVSSSLSVYLWRRGSSQAAYYLLIFGIVELATVVRFARNIDWLPINLFTDYAIFIGIALHLVAMSIYLITHFRNMQQALASEQEARAEQRDFIGLVSHEFKTPLAIINTSIQLLSANPDAPKEKMRQRADNIRNAVLRMDRLLDDYFSVERMDAAHQPMRLVKTDFFEVIEEAVSDWPLGKIRLHVDKLPEPHLCDPDLMRIVLRNLIENAIRHSPFAC